MFTFITTCDYAIDVHTPTRGSRYVPITILPHPALGGAFRRTEEPAVAFGSGFHMMTEQSLYVQDGILCVEVTRASVPSFTFEIGEGGRLEADVIPIGVRCVLNALRFLRMLPGEPEAPPQTVVMTRFVELRATKGELLHTEMGLGSASEEPGTGLARIYSVYLANRHVPIFLPYGLISKIELIPRTL